MMNQAIDTDDLQVNSRFAKVSGAVLEKLTLMIEQGDFETLESLVCHDAQGNVDGEFLTRADFIRMGQELWQEIDSPLVEIQRINDLVERPEGFMLSIFMQISAVVPKFWETRTATLLISLIIMDEEAGVKISGITIRTANDIELAPRALSNTLHSMSGSLSQTDFYNFLV